MPELALFVFPANGVVVAVREEVFAVVQAFRRNSHRCYDIRADESPEFGTVIPRVQVIQARLLACKIALTAKRYINYEGDKKLFYRLMCFTVKHKKGLFLANGSFSYFPLGKVQEGSLRIQSLLRIGSETRQGNDAVDLSFIPLSPFLLQLVGQGKKCPLALIQHSSWSGFSPTCSSSQDRRTVPSSWTKRHA